MPAPELTRRLPKYRLHKPSGQAVVTLGGRDIYLGRWDSPESHAAYDGQIQRWLAQGRPNAFGAAEGGCTVAELALGFLDYADVAYKKRGQFTSHRHNVDSALRPLADLY